ncbi:AGAP008361-PA [Sergentomyia squamirostris]
MALANFSLPFGAAVNQPWVGNLNPLQPPPQHISAVNNLLYGPAGHQENDVPLPENENDHEAFFKNNPYAPPRNSQYRTRNNYLPPPPGSQQQQPQPAAPAYAQHTPRNYQQPTTRTYGEGLYSMPPPSSGNTQQQFFGGGGGVNQQNNYNNGQPYSVPPTQSPPSGSPRNVPPSQKTNQPAAPSAPGGYPQRPGGYTQVNAGTGSRTQVHAVLDYDDEDTDYHDENNPDSRRKPQVPGELLLLPKTPHSYD